MSKMIRLSYRGLRLCVSDIPGLMRHRLPPLSPAMPLHLRCYTVQALTHTPLTVASH